MMMTGVMMQVAAAAFLILSGILTSAQVEARDYRLGVGDKVRIQVYEWPDLSGEYRVGPDGALFVSLIGQVAAEGLTPIELASVISQRLRSETRVESEPNTTIEVTEYRPFYILGDVQQPGEFAYRPGLTVLQATSIAGGMFRVGGTSPQNYRNAIVSRGELALLNLEIDQLIARKVRLDGELDGLNELEFPSNFATHDSSYIRRLMAEELLLFEANKVQHSEHFEVLTGLQAFYEAEAEVLVEQGKDALKQIASAEQHLENVESLVSRGLAPAPRQFDMERVVAGVTNNQRQIETNLLRAKQSVAETKQRLLDLHWQRRNKVITESQLTEAALEAARQRLATIQTLILEAEVDTPVMQERQDQAIASSKIEYEIIRTSGADVKKMVVDEHLPVEPGDVIKVRRVFSPLSRSRF